MRNINKVHELLYILFLISGWPLFSLISFMERSLAWGLLMNTLLEECMKVLLFTFALITRRFILKNKMQSIYSIYLFPLLMILGFGITENIVYFLRFPSGSIFFRLLYSYPIHVNIGLIYILVFERKKGPLAYIVLVPSMLYHYGLNLLSLATESRLVLGTVGLVNLLLFVYLIWKVQELFVVRSYINARR